MCHSISHLQLLKTTLTKTSTACDFDLPFYQYEPISANSAEDEIRLLTILDEETVLISHTRLSNAPLCRALSYCWGDLTKPRKPVKVFSSASSSSQLCQL